MCSSPHGGKLTGLQTLKWLFNWVIIICIKVQLYPFICHHNIQPYQNGLQCMLWWWGCMWIWRLGKDKGKYFPLPPCKLPDCNWAFMDLTSSLAGADLGDIGRVPAATRGDRIWHSIQYWVPPPSPWDGAALAVFRCTVSHITKELFAMAVEFLPHKLVLAATEPNRLGL